MNTLTASLYESDFYGWTLQQAEALRSRDMNELDFENLLEEMEAMGRSEKRGLKNRLVILLMHLLKWQYQPEHQGKSWKLTIRNQREEVLELLEENPSLKPHIDSILENAWKKALRETEKETKIVRSTFPTQCPWSFEQIMDDDFWPD